MNGLISNAEATNPRGSSRRSFLSGLILGGASGALAAALAFRARSSNSKQEGNRPVTDLSEAFRTLDHQRFMREAIARAKNVPDLPFGAVIVLAERAEIVADGFNRSKLNPTYHGEVDAINRCAESQPEIDWNGLVLYTTAEPCPMCQSAVEWAGIRMVVFGSSIPFLKSLGFWQIDIRAEEVARRTPFHHCALLGGVLEKECDALFLATGRKPVK